MSELGYAFDSSSSTAEAVEDIENIGAWLHRDDAELILFVNPDEESLIVVVEDATTAWPVTVETTCFEEAVSLLKQKVIINQLLLSVMIHALEWVERTLQVTFEGVAGLDNVVHNLKALLLSDTRAERESSEVAADTDPGRQDHGLALFGERLD